VAIARDLEPTGYDIDVSAISGLFMQADQERRSGFIASLRERFGKPH
jgi:hypothetical protein